MNMLGFLDELVPVTVAFFHDDVCWFQLRLEERRPDPFVLERDGWSENVQAFVDRLLCKRERKSSRLTNSRRQRRMRAARKASATSYPKPSHHHRRGRRRSSRETLTIPVVDGSDTCYCALGRLEETSTRHDTPPFSILRIG